MDVATDRPDLRSIRVFVSSTFRDMQLEREELVKRVFPQLRRMCEQRGVTWSEVDLRWGVTDEQKAEGAVLPICLAEIDRSRPFFIGLLGQRYGWIPDEMPDGLPDQMPWLRELAKTSVTEMEILHGVLNDPTAAGHAFFYLRDPAWVEAQGDGERGNYVDDDDDADERRDLLDGLKQRIVASGLPTWEYPDPRQLGERVLADFSAVIDRLYPTPDGVDGSERDEAAHRAFGLAQLHGHHPRATLEAALDLWARGDQPPLVLAGEAGADTSAVATSWLTRWREQHPEDIVVEHHVGATADASDWESMSRRVVTDLGRRHPFTLADALAQPVGPAAHRAALVAAIGRAGNAARRTVVLVDNADLLDDRDGAPDLTWLPEVMPRSVRVLVTSTGARPVEAARRRGWPTATVPALDADERRDLIRSTLGRYAKGLDEVHVARLVAAPATGNALYLRTVLDELRQHGDHFTLADVIGHYLAAPDLDALLGFVLARYEQDFDRDRPGLVRDAMRSVWAARRGLSDAELTRVLGTADAPLPHAVWSPLLLAAEAGLVTRGGLTTFASEPHRRAVAARYVATEHDRQEAHASVAASFAATPLSPRVVDELPWQQLGAGDVAGLAATLADLDFLELAYPVAHADLRRLWARAEEGGASIVEAYAAVIADPHAHPAAVWEVARLVTDAGHPVEALGLHRHLVATYRAGTDDVSRRRLPAALVNLGAALLAQGELVAAATPLQEAVELGRQRNDLTTLTAALGNLALIRREQGDMVTANGLFAEEEAICRRVGDLTGLQISLGNRSTVLTRAGDFAGALALAREQEHVCRQIGDAVGAERALAAQATVLAEQGSPAEALPHYQRLHHSLAEAGDRRGAAEVGINVATTLRQLGRFEESEQVALATEATLRQLSDEPLLARILDTRARTATDLGQWVDAERLATEALLTARGAGIPAVEILALGIIGTARRERGDIAGARSAHLEEEQLATRARQPASIATAQSNLASVDIVSNNMAGALAYYAHAEPVLRQLNQHSVLVPLYNNRAQVLQMTGDVAGAITDLRAGAVSAAAVGALPQSQQMLTRAIELLYAAGRQAESEPLWENMAEIARALGDHATLQRAIGDRALLAIGRGDHATAAALLDEQERICRGIGDMVGLAACVGNRAILLRNTGDLVGALACVDQQLDIARNSGNGQGYLFATANRGELLGALGRVAEGLAALSEARSIATTHGLAPMVQELDRMIAALRAGQQ